MSNATTAPALTVNAEFVLRGVKHVITSVSAKTVEYRVAGATRTPYRTSPVAFLSLVGAEIIVMVN